MQPVGLAIAIPLYPFKRTIEACTGRIDDVMQGRSKDDVETEEVRERHEKLSDDIDRILDDIDELLEPDAEAFVRSYVQKAGNGGGQYLALAERVIDRFGHQVGRELFYFLRNRIDEALRDGGYYPSGRLYL
jgi:prokaryotic ubiquitin-like protein Pup